MGRVTDAVAVVGLLVFMVVLDKVSWVSVSMDIWGDISRLVGSGCFSLELVGSDWSISSQVGKS